jgi:dephospho-CoA kinase
MSNNLLRIGITGGIGSGKSTVANIFSLLGVPVYNADNRAKWLMVNDEELVKNITDYFGPDSYIDGKLNNHHLAEKVFKDGDLVTKLNSLVHPAVAKDFADWSNKYTSGYVLKEAALLFETGSYKELNATILTTSPRDLRIERITERDSQRSLEQIENIISRQMTVQEAKVKADFVIANNDTSLLILQVLELHSILQKKADPEFSGPANC